MLFARIKNITITLKIYLLLISAFTFFRIILFITNRDKISDTNGSINWVNVALAFFMGLRFDIVVAGYLLLLPFFILTIISVSNYNLKLVLRLLYYFMILISTIALILSAADIPYFDQFFSRISVSALQWIDSPVFILKMIIQEPRYYLILLPLILVLFIYYKLLKNIFASYSQNNIVKPNKAIHILLSILFIIVMLVGIRGRVEIKSPIRVGTAYFCNNSFLNQAGLNPVFTFITSYLDKVNPYNKYLNLMDDGLAVRNVQKYFNVGPNEIDSPIARWINPEKVSSEKPNIVIVIMESMSAAKMGRYGSKDQLTPHLDTLAQQGLSFDNIYTAGIHTYNGVFSTLFSFPALAAQHPMKASNMLKYNGIASTLKQFDYQTVYFTTHDGQFDNAEGFLYHNSFDKVYTKSDYPDEKILSTLGVPDDYLFDFAGSKLDDLNSTNKPFLSIILTASDHGPYIIPEYFKPKPNEITKQIVEYADWSIGKFISNAKMKSWFENTIFVFVADHGAALSPVYEMPINYHHSPLIFYAPKIFKEPKVYNQIGGQIDIFPTIMGLLNYPYMNNTFGVDLLKEWRPYICFSADDKYGVLSDSLFLIVNNQGRESLFKYRINDVKNYLNEYERIAHEMKEYAASNMQAAQYILKNNKQYSQSISDNNLK
jgi:phosphoglycerol transferase MdoB-like AlkP superfamily enzyme